MKIKVFFAASSDVDQPETKKYKQIISVLKKKDCYVDQIFLNKKKYDLPTGEIEFDKIYKNVIAKINNSDIFIADITYASGGIGYQIYHAFYQKKPIIIIYTENKRSNPSMVIRGIKSKKVKIIKYINLDDLEDNLIKTLNKTKRQLKTRFNLVMNNKNYVFVEKMAKNNNISKTQYINNLIRKAIV